MNFVLAEPLFPAFHCALARIIFCGLVLRSGDLVDYVLNHFTDVVFVWNQTIRKRVVPNNPEARCVAVCIGCT